MDQQRNGEAATSSTADALDTSDIATTVEQQSSEFVIAVEAGSMEHGIAGSPFEQTDGPSELPLTSDENAERGNVTIPSSISKRLVFDLRTVLNMSAAAWTGYLMPTEGGKYVNTRRNGTTTQYLNEAFAIENFCAVLKVSVVAIKSSGEDIVGVC